MNMRLLVPLAATALVASGCSAISSALTGGDGETESDQVAVAFYPLEYVADRVGGDHFDILTLTAPGQEAHDVALSISTTAAVSEAGLVIYESGFQPAVDQTVAQNASGRTLDVADVVDLIDAHHEAESADHDHDDHEGHDDEHDHEGHDEHDHEGHDHGDSHDGHDHGDLDPHFWLDPLLLADVTDAVADEMIELAPDHADEIRDNAADLRADLEQLDHDYTEGLASCERDTVVVNHDAFGYLARYGLHFEAVVGLSPARRRPSPTSTGCRTW